ncbi:MAG: hypothetical protein WCR54_06770 [Clostridia bacterium]
MQAKFKKSRKSFTSIAVSFLILILMVLTLTTSTYAWYSSINRARIHDITFTAGSNDTVAGDLSITWDPLLTGTSVLDFNTISTQLSPMIPKYDLSKGTTTFHQFINNGFYYTYQKQNDENVWVVGRDGIYTTPYILNGTVANQEYFYLVNVKTTKTQDINAYYDITGIISDQLKIAIFVGDTEDENDLVLQGIMSNSEHIHFGELFEGDPVGAATTMSNAYSISGTVAFTIPADSYKVIKLVAWLDGVTMLNTDSENSSSFNIYFDGVENEI